GSRRTSLPSGASFRFRCSACCALWQLPGSFTRYASSMRLRASRQASRPWPDMWSSAPFLTADFSRISGSSWQCAANVNRPPLPSEVAHDGHRDAHTLFTNAVLSVLTTGPTTMPTLVDRQAMRAALALALIAIAIYLPLIGWGLPYATTSTRIKTYAVDELLP